MSKELSKNFKVDVPPGESGDKWLLNKQKDAVSYAEKYPDSPATANLLTGSTTCWTPEFLKINPIFLTDLAGAMGEELFRHDPNGVKHSALDKSITEDGYNDESPISIAINHKGEAFISEGNHRVTLAAKHGVSQISVEVRYINGGERVEGGFEPEFFNRIEKQTKEMIEDSVVNFIKDKDITKTPAAKMSAKKIKVGQ
jgi:hypothetical protein